MESEELPQAYDARQALADVSASRRAVAARLVTPWWYHPILGLNIGFLLWLLANADVVGHTTFMAGAFASTFVSLALISAYKRLTGLWVGAEEVGPRSRRLWTAYAVIIVLGLFAALLAGPIAGVPQAGILIGLVCGVTTIVIGRRMDETMREEIRDGSMPIPKAGR